jgi:hypothetical protein
MNSICVYCGSSLGARESYRRAAEALGQELARRGLTLVYGGGNVGLMGAMADAALAAGGKVIGVIPQALLDKELGHDGLSELRVVASMHERKAQMAELADGFIAMPGGFGTLEEFCEITTWTQLGFHRKPCGLLNVEGFYDSLLAFLDHATDDGFIWQLHRDIVLSDHRPAALIDRLAALHLPTVHKWIDREQR